jgi:hypothetical protein
MFDRHQLREDPLRMLDLAFKYRVKPWVMTAVENILTESDGIIRMVKTDKIRHVPAKALLTITYASHEIAHVCKTAAQQALWVPKALYDGPSHDHKACEARWREYWDCIVRPELTKRTKPLKLEDLYDFLTGERRIKTMAPMCAEKMLSKLQHHPFFGIEWKATRIAANRIQKLIPRSCFDELNLLISKRM